MDKSDKILKNFKRFMTVTALVTLFLVGAVSSFAATYTLTPWAYDPRNTGGVISEVESDGSLYLEKDAYSSSNAAAGATIENVEDLSTTDLTLSYQIDGVCSSNAPRINIYLNNGQTIALNCTYGQRGAGYVSFTAGNKYGGVVLPLHQTVRGIDIILAQQGKATLSNITLNGILVTVTPKTLEDQCKKHSVKNCLK